MTAEVSSKIPVGWVVAVATACVVLVVSRLLDIPVLPAASKMLASSAFIAIALVSGGLTHRFGKLVVAGLVLSWIGDALLLGTTESLFMAGLVSFLLAHIVYMSAFLVHGVSKRWILMAILPVALVSTGAAVWLAPYVPDGMVIPVRVYTFVISCMFIAAIGVRGAGGPLLIPLGAALFYFSDLSVAAGQFVQTDFPNYVWGLPFYYAGQTLIALSSGTGAGSR
jgi:uncharacterized membrane protein YhhN